MTIFYVVIALFKKRNIPEVTKGCPNSEKSGKLLSYLICKSRLHEDFTMAYSYKFIKLARQPFFQKEIYTAASSPILIVELNLHKLERNSGK